jgi:hypothetical protein
VARVPLALPDERGFIRFIIAGESILSDGVKSQPRNETAFPKDGQACLTELF